ncbi:TraG family conjugative transposon ATPase [Chitinophaga cymbidii]|uniref:Transposase n=1 Tax=Chitinophaga cymbidii TaxID=1096750 RepID=A0A512RSA5_9BACT|nr:TraG family conjugative transposon ATPase [Chitinophaga cymbidii]GEP98569.1 transposase [Chitinophaga cymbidii]
MRKNKTLESVFPIHKIEKDFLIAKSGSVSIAFSVVLPEIFTMSSADYEALHAAFVKAIRVLPEHTIVHKQDWYVEDAFRPSASADSFLMDASDRHFSERPFLRHECYIFLSTVPPALLNPAPTAGVLFRTSPVARELLDDRRFEVFAEKASQFAAVLQDSGFLELRRLDGDDLASSPNRAGLLERYCYQLAEDQIPVLADFKTGGELSVAGHSLHIFSLADPDDLPSLCGPRLNYEKYSTERTPFSIGFGAPLGLLLHCNHIVNQYIIVGDGAGTLRQLETKRKRLQSLSAYSRENAISRDATSAFLNEAIGQGRLPVKAHLNVIAWHDDPAKSRELRNMVSSAMAALDGKAKLETAAAACLFWAGIPGNGAELPSTSRFDTFAEQAVCFFNVETNYRTSLAAQGIRFGDRLTGRPLQVDLFYEPFDRGLIQNRNIFLCGPSGSGKSFATNHILRSCNECGDHILVVDVGHSYKGLCDLLGGYYFTFSEKNPISFNPFFVPDNQLDTEKREAIKSLLLALWKKDDEAYSRSEYISLSNALQSYFDKLKADPGVLPCFNTFYDYLRDVFVPELRQQGVKDKHFDIDNFLYVLRPYYTGGEYDYLLNATENLDLLHTNFIVYELDAIRDHPILLPAVTLTLAENFLNKMRRLKGVRKIILIEEAWKAIARAGMAEYIRYLFKTVRKFYGTAAVVTQEIDDIISSPIIKDTIIANSDIKILLDQSKYANKFQAVQDALGLTDRDRSLILSMNKANDPHLKYKEIFISLGAYSKVYRTEVSLEEYLCYTTEEREKLLVQQYAARYGSIRRGISRLAADIRSKKI